MLFTLYFRWKFDRRTDQRVIVACYEDERSEEMLRKTVDGIGVVTSGFELIFLQYKR